MRMPRTLMRRRIGALVLNRVLLETAVAGEPRCSVMISPCIIFQVILLFFSPVSSGLVSLTYYVMIFQSLEDELLPV